MFIIASIVVALIAIIGGYTAYEKTKCPEGTNNTNTGGEAKPGCKCPDQKVFLDGTCKDCGTSAVYKDGKCIQCESGAISNTKTTMPTLTYGCYCPEGTAFINGICQTCLGGSSGSGSGGNAMPFGCKCPSDQVYENGQCKTCGNTKIYENGVCIECPQGATSTVSNITTNINKCFCPPGSTFDTILKTCKTCLGGSSGDGTGAEVSPGCYCPAGQVYGLNSGKMECKTCGSSAYYLDKTCVNCPNGSSIDRVEGSVSTSDPNCYCPPNYTFISNKSGGTCEPCIGGSSFYGLGGAASPDGCKCPDGKVFNPITKMCEPCPSTHVFKNGSCVLCTGGSSPNLTGVTANIAGCNCPLNSIYENNTCKTCPEGTNLINSGGSYPLIPVCKCPDLQEYKNGICQYCGNTSIYKNGVCLSCPQGASTTIKDGIPTSVPECYCPPEQVFFNNSCTSCPTGSSKTGSILNKTSVEGCYCPEKQVFDFTNKQCNYCINTKIYNNGSCIDCPVGTTSEANTSSNTKSNIEGCYCPETKVWYEGSCMECPIGSSKSNTGTVTIPGCYCPPGQDYDIINKKCNTSSDTLIFNTTTKSFVQCVPGSSSTNTGVTANYESCYCPENKEFINNTCTLCIPIIVNSNFKNGTNSWISTGSTVSSYELVSDKILTDITKTIPYTNWSGQSISQSGITGIVNDGSYVLFLTLSYNIEAYPPALKVSIIEESTKSVKLTKTLDSNQFNFQPTKNFKVFLIEIPSYTVNTGNNYKLELSCVNNYVAYGFIYYHSIQIAKTNIIENNLTCGYPIIGNPKFENKIIVPDYLQLTTQTLPSWNYSGVIFLVINNASIWNKTISRLTSNVSNCMLVIQDGGQINQNIKYFNTSYTYTLYITMMHSPFTPIGDYLIYFEDSKSDKIILNYARTATTFLSDTSFITYKYMFQPTETMLKLVIACTTLNSTCQIVIDSVYIALNT